jgi:ActR/RegA family two-component response regulator
MTMQLESTTRFRPAPRAERTVVVVTRNPDDRVIETIDGAGDFDTIVVESVEGAYSKVKCVLPSLVIVCLSIDDPNGFHLLSMLKLDRDTSQIPVLTCATSDERPESLSRMPATWMN